MPVIEKRKWRVMICRNRACKFSGLEKKHWHEFDGKVHTFTCLICGSTTTVQHGNAVKRYEKSRAGRERHRLTSILPRESFF